MIVYIISPNNGKDTTKYTTKYTTIVLPDAAGDAVVLNSDATPPENKKKSHSKYSLVLG